MIWALPCLAATVRVGLFVGADVGLPDEPALVYAEGEAREVARVFQDMGGFARENVTVLQGATATELREAMRQIDVQTRAVPSGDDVLLVFYYSGHADRQGLHLSGTALPTDELRQWLERHPAQVRVAFVDACESGELARGGSPAPVLQVGVEEALTARGLAIVTSTGPLSVARESQAFGGGVFTRALLSGLRGAADRDGDGVITLDEAYRHAFEDTVLDTARSSSGVQRPEYRYALAGVGQVPLTRVAGGAAVVLPEEAQGSYAVVSLASGQVVARIDKEPGETRRIALPTGRYVVRKIRQGDVLVGEIDLIWGGERWIEDDELALALPGEGTSRRGGARSSLGALLLGGPSFLRGNPAQWGGALELGRQVWPGWRVLAAAAATTGSRSEWGGEVRTQQGRLSAGVEALHRTRHLDLAVGGGAAAVGVSQRLRWVAPAGERAEHQLQLAPALWVGGSLGVPLGGRLGLVGAVRGHLVRASVNAEVGFYVQLEGQTGLSLAF